MIHQCGKPINSATACEACDKIDRILEAIGKRCRIATEWGSFSGKEGKIVAYDADLDAFTVDLGDAFPLTFGVSVVQVLP